MADTMERADYFLASDEEMNRLSNQHNVIKDAMGGLLLIPVDLSTGTLRILDSATADGTWIRDLYDHAPTQSFVGTDIDASKFPENPAPGITYQIQDINKPWPAEWHESFDIVHQRLTLVAAGSAAKAAVHNLAALVKPGGWIQLIEAENVLTNNDGPALHDFVRLMRDIFAVMGTSLTLARELPEMLREEGFVEIKERLVTMQLGTSNPDPQLARQGSYSTAVAATSLIQFASTLPPASLSLQQGRLETLLPDLKQELIERGGSYPLRIVCGQKQ